MQHLLTPYSEPMQPFAWWEGAFTPQELNSLQEKARKAETKAKVGNRQLNNDVRRASISWIGKDADSAWVFERLGDIAGRLNSQYFKLDLIGFGEQLQLTNYDQSEHGMYGWHQDYGSIISRKLSLVMQLTDPSEYEGGNLQVMTTGQPVNIMKQRGLIVAFPAYTLHQVTPVTQGNRQSLVAWISGPPFK